MIRRLGHPLLFFSLANAALWVSPMLLDKIQEISFNTQLNQLVGFSQPIDDELAQLMLLDPLYEPIANTKPTPELSPLPISSTAPASTEPVSYDLSSDRIHDAEPPLSRSNTSLMQRLQMADGLGGEITLSSLQEPLVPVAVRAERLMQRRSGDPLAALPKHWRDAMRREVGETEVSEVATIRLPAPGVGARQEIPLVVDDQGRGSSLVTPSSPEVKTVVERWASYQSPASPGTVKVMVVAAEPLRQQPVSPDQVALPSP